MSVRHVIILIMVGVAILSVSAVQALTVTTGSVIANATTGCVVFHGTSDGYGYVWFEYGSTEQSLDPTNTSPTDTRPFATKRQIAAGTLTDSRCGLPLFPGKHYLVRAAGNTNLSDPLIGYVTGDDVEFTYSVPVTPHVTVTYEQQLDIMLNEGGYDTPFINGQKILTNDIWLVYTEVLGSLFFGLIVAFIFINITIKQRTVVMAFLLTLLTGTTLWAFMPDEFVFMAQSMTIIAISGLLFWLFMKRK